MEGLPTDHRSSQFHGRAVRFTGAGFRFIPRGAKLMELSIRFDQLIRDGVIADQAEVARLSMCRGRGEGLTQIMNLLNLPPDIQEEILFLPRAMQGSDEISERELRPVVREVCRKKQRQLFASLY